MRPARIRQATGLIFWHNSSGYHQTMGRTVKYLLIFLLVLVIFIISVTLGAHNDQVVTFNYLLAQGEYRVSTLLATLFAAGFLIGWAICGLFWLRLRVALANSQRKLKRLQQKLGQAEEAAAQPAVPAVKE